MDAPGKTPAEPVARLLTKLRSLANAQAPNSVDRHFEIALKVTVSLYTMSNVTPEGITRPIGRQSSHAAWRSNRRHMRACDVKDGGA